MWYEDFCYADFLRKTFRAKPQTCNKLGLWK